ncbi:hypothetical protein D918_06483 [Trichuris suis]|nr:hypothetical protein D918_06483 [Trichuris suis]
MQFNMDLHNTSKNQSLDDWKNNHLCFISERLTGMVSSTFKRMRTREYQFSFIIRSDVKEVLHFRGYSILHLPFHMQFTECFWS